MISGVPNIAATDTAAAASYTQSYKCAFGVAASGASKQASHVAQFQLTPTPGGRVVGHCAVLRRDASIHTGPKSRMGVPQCEYR